MNTDTPEQIRAAEKRLLTQMRFCKDLIALYKLISLRAQWSAKNNLFGLVADMTLSVMIKAYIAWVDWRYPDANPDADWGAL